MLNYNLVITISAVVLSLECSHVAGTEAPRVRGVPISKASLYNPSRDFECLDGSRRIQFSRVNDDYCDCGDGSDEPGTAACPNGFFYCQNAGYEASYIPSSRVNDGVCDCCDASDEYASNSKCIDNCHELGREARAEAEKAAELAREGNQIRLEMIAKGKQLKGESTAKLTKLKADYLEAELLKKEKEAIKNQAEERENLALEKYKPAEVEQPPKEEPREIDAEEYFRMIDSDESKTVSVAEIQTRITFDKDGNGVVTEEEAIFFLGGDDEVNLEEFVEKAWGNIKPFLMREQGMFVPPSQAEDADHGEEEDLDDSPQKEDHHDEDDEEHDDDGDDAPEEVHEEKEAEPAVIYDDETQALIDEATEARTQFQAADKSLLDIQNEIRDLENKIERDYGPDEVFAPLDGECFKFTDLEYVYTMCLYGRATQSAKSGGSEVSLGHWYDWAGPDNNKYSKAKFDRGLTCWNGPARTAMLELRCGKENRLISVSEPSRCEYAMIFTTPALCDSSAQKSGQHDEL